MKKLLSAFALTLALFTFAACGDPTGENNNDDNENKDTYLVTEDTEFAPGWYKLTQTDSDGGVYIEYYYFTSLEEPVVRAGDAEKEYSGEKLASYQKFLGFDQVKENVKLGCNLVKISEEELPAHFLRFEEGWYKLEILNYTEGIRNAQIEYYKFDSTEQLSRVGSDSEEYTKEKFDFYKELMPWSSIRTIINENNDDYKITKITEEELPDWAKTTK